MRGTEGWPGYDAKQEVSKGSKGSGAAAANAKTKLEAEKKKRRCTIQRDECFGLKGADGGPPTASAIFKEIAFNKPKCGDCGTFLPSILALLERRLTA